MECYLDRRMTPYNNTEGCGIVAKPIATVSGLGSKAPLSYNEISISWWKGLYARISVLTGSRLFVNR
jgi:hypothetical protein